MTGKRVLQALTKRFGDVPVTRIMKPYPDCDEPDIEVRTWKLSDGSSVRFRWEPSFEGNTHYSEKWSLKLSVPSPEAILALLAMTDATCVDAKKGGDA